MKLTLKEIREAEAGLMELGNKEIADQKISYRIARMIRKLMPEYEQIEKSRRAIAQKHGATPKTPVSSEKAEEASKEFEDFLMQTIDVDIEPITEEMLKGLVIKPSVYVSLGNLYVPTKE